MSSANAICLLPGSAAAAMIQQVRWSKLRRVKAGLLFLVNLAS
jgi:hypothetical protein